MTAHRITRSARLDLQEISDYWTSQASETQAFEVVGGVMEAIITVSGYPQAGIAANRFGERVRKRLPRRSRPIKSLAYETAATETRQVSIRSHERCPLGAGVS